MTAKSRPVAWMKVYGRDRNYLASCVEPEGAAALVALAGEGATIRNGHALKNAIWTEGKEAQPAGESYDFVAVTIRERMASRACMAADDEAARKVERGLDQARTYTRGVLANIK